MIDSIRELLELVRWKEPVAAALRPLLVQDENLLHEMADNLVAPDNTRSFLPLLI